MMNLKYYLLFVLIPFLTNGQETSEIILAEGFYSNGWENSTFYEIKGNKIIDFSWLEFDKSIKFLSSTEKIIFEDNLDGVYIKFYGRRKTGKYYGHLGIAKSLVTVTEILEIDSSKTLSIFSSLKKTSEKKIIPLDSITWEKINNSKFNRINDSLIKIKPINFLRYLTTTNFKNNLIQNRDSSFAPSICFYNRINKNWITKDDVEQLMNYIKSKEFAYIPYSVLSSAASTEKSTVGIEAMHLIKIYRNKEFYYPDLCSTVYFCKPENQDKLAQEYIIWWENLKE
ncbi:hypothetical protein OX283_012750 [Flavobacterium sp. SUN052]|uniref:hypothetical protein n=1 Tax=Flavobacterium sp. SUN052 TaxID=3002441 RepID=UPI00237E0105|nr:hypothetical protein [Flavobacterium sp. SUN052]MEC4005531.1 hypothetical protein [Flavobacterium sp. SUN052]